VPSAFHDVTVATSGVTSCDGNVPSMCNNSIPGPTGLAGTQPGYLVTTGYDEVTGLGSLDVQTFIKNYSNYSSTAVLPPFGYIGDAADSVTGSTPVFLADSVLISGWVADQVDGAPVSIVKVYIDGTLARYTYPEDCRSGCSSGLRQRHLHQLRLQVALSGDIALCRYACRHRRRDRLGWTFSHARATDVQRAIALYKPGRPPSSCNNGTTSKASREFS
jgi:hypothetical protein